MKQGKEKGSTSASLCEHLSKGYLHMTPEDATHEDYRTVGSICCPNCSHKFEPELEIFMDFLKKCVTELGGVKFEPSDQQLIDHLEAKINRSGDPKPNPLIDEFIATIEGDEGICYTHPGRLPGITKDGTSKYFFHKPSKAYKTGTRQRRKIRKEPFNFSETRWHKTGKTKPIISNGIQKGCKKILVLYTNFGKNRKPIKTNWVMHQYHLNASAVEREGELAVSKIFYQTQPRQPNEGKKHTVAYELSERSNNSEVPSEPRRRHEACEPVNYMQMPPHLNILESMPLVSPMPDFHLDQPNGPIPPVVMPPPMHEALALFANNHEQNILAANTYQLEQQQLFHGNATTSLEEMMMDCTSTDPREGTLNLHSQAEWEYFNWPTDDAQGCHGPHENLGYTENKEEEKTKEA